MSKTKAEEMWRCADGDYIRNPKLGGAVVEEGIAVRGLFIPGLTLGEWRKLLEDAIEYAGLALQFTGDYTVTDEDEKAQDEFIAKCEALRATLPEEADGNGRT